MFAVDLKMLMKFLSLLNIATAQFNLKYLFFTRSLIPWKLYRANMTYYLLYCILMPVSILVIPTDTFTKGFGNIKMNHADLRPVFLRENLDR